jgi:hypothetical protein
LKPVVFGLLDNFTRSMGVMVQLLEAPLRQGPVMTIFTSQIATRTGDAQPKMPGDKMIERRLFNGTDIDGAGFPVDNRI